LDVFLATSLSLATAKVHSEMGNYDEVVNYYAQEATYRPFFSAAEDLRIVLDKRKGIDTFPTTFLGK